MSLRMAAAVHLLEHGASAARAEERVDPVREKVVRPARLALTLRMIRSGKIPSAMSIFKEDVCAIREGSRIAFTPRDVQFMIVELKNCSRSPIASKVSFSRQPASREPWRPQMLDESVDPNSIPIFQQCLFAMAEVWDDSVSLGIYPSTKSVASLVSCFAQFLPAESLVQAVERAISDHASLSKRSPLSSLSLGCLFSLIKAYGLCDKAKKGEQLLSDWASHFARGKAKVTFCDLVSEGSGDGSTAPTPSGPADFALNGWSQDVYIWNALIKARWDSGDLRGAGIWLQRYRSMISPKNESRIRRLGLERPQVKDAPYLTYLRAAVSLGTPSRKRSAAVFSINTQAMEMMKEDGVMPGNGVLRFVIGELASLSRTEQAAGFLDMILLSHREETESRGISDAQLTFRPDGLTYVTLFDLHHKHSRSQSKNALFPLSKYPASEAEYDIIRTPRSLLRHLLRQHHESTSSKPRAPCKLKNVETLNAALRACLSDRDFPAAVVTLRTFAAWGVYPNLSTHLITLKGVTRGMPGSRRTGQVKEEAARNSAVPEAVLDYVRTQGADWQALAQEMIPNPLIRAALAEGDVLQFQAKPSLEGFGHTAYLYDILQSSIFEELKVAGVQSEQPCSSAGSGLKEADAAAPWAIRAFSRHWENVSSLERTQSSQMFNKVMNDTNEELLPRSTCQTVLESGKRSSSPRRVVSSPPLFSKPIGRPSAAQTGATSLVRHARFSSTSCSGSRIRDPSRLTPIRYVYIPHLVPYALGLSLQEHLVSKRASARAHLRAQPSASPASLLSDPDPCTAKAVKVAETDTLLLLQHKAVYTEGRREAKEVESVSNRLRALGADYHVTKRGGQITYHGPGQLVGYPILDIGAMELSTRCYVDRTQNWLRSVLEEDLDLSTVPPPEDHTGVWSDEYHKIASIGIQVRHRITSHGFALNVEERSMRGFQHIVACGIRGRGMTCLEDQLVKSRNLSAPPLTDSLTSDQGKAKGTDATVPGIVPLIVKSIGRVLAREMRPVTQQEMRVRAGPDAAEYGRGLGIAEVEGEKILDAVWVDGEQVQPLEG
ncbi:hypothetical protein IE53DRAFT_361286 [Violaceomyces palustris]|uniref:Uncharacterized protein n=1 Tax=Violaceomyces palustris TaxID=1673888 RepID=A0ACD0P194_9BASI|nr:hypothetical protein IE53DRAFT_361286 [Violaceomyces palustris]